MVVASACRMIMIMAVRGAVGMDMLVFMVAVFTVNAYFSSAATACGTHLLSPSKLLRVP
jgi:hypothetical protein